MDNTDSTKITFPEFYCKRCKSNKKPEDFKYMAKSDKYTKTCSLCLSKKRDAFRRANGECHIRAERLVKTARELASPEILGGDKKYLELLMKPMRELCSD